MLTSERSYKRKIQEAYLALQLESKYTKDQILEAYLNDVNMGEGNYGVRAPPAIILENRWMSSRCVNAPCWQASSMRPFTYNPRRNYYVKIGREVTNERTDLVQ